MDSDCSRRFPKCSCQVIYRKVRSFLSMTLDVANFFMKKCCSNAFTQVVKKSAQLPARFCAQTKLLAKSVLKNKRVVCALRVAIRLMERLERVVAYGSSA